MNYYSVRERGFVSRSKLCYFKRAHCKYFKLKLIAVAAVLRDGIYITSTYFYVILKGKYKELLPHYNISINVALQNFQF